MNCKDIEQNNVVEEYLLNRLPEPERDEFEKHYFECQSCFSQLQTGLTIQAHLRREPLLRTHLGGVFLRQVWAWTPALVTVVLLFCVGIWWYSARKLRPPQKASFPPISKPAVSQASPAALSLEELARVEPPPYAPVVLRGAEDEAQETFRNAMQYYLRGDYMHAIPELRATVKASPRTARFNFYLGACYLLDDQTDSAIDTFRKTVSLGEPTYLEPAHFYLAKAYLRKKDVSNAAGELQTTIQLHGRKEHEASEILRQLRK